MLGRLAGRRVASGPFSSLASSSTANVSQLSSLGVVSNVSFTALRCTAPMARLPTIACLNINRRMASTSTSDEDKAEAERERLLRERLASKQPAAGGNFWATIRQQAQQMAEQRRAEAAAAGGASSGAGAAGTSRPQVPAGIQLVYSVLLYGTAFYAVLLVWQSGNPESVISTLQGMPHYAAAPETVAVQLLGRILLPLSQQRELKDQVETHARNVPFGNSGTYVLSTRPDLFSGYRTSTQEAIAVIAACVRTTGSMKFANQSVAPAARANSRDPKAAVDAIVDALRRDFPQAAYAMPAPAQFVFAPQR